MISAIHAFLAENVTKIPFLILGTDGFSVKLSAQRLIEAAVIGAALAGIGYVAVIPKMQEHMALEFRHIRENIDDLKRKVERIEFQREKDYRELSKEIRNR